MPGLDGEDAASGSQVILAHDAGGGAEVGADTDTLEDGGCDDEAVDIGDTECICALSNWVGASSLKTTGQEVDVGLLIGTDGNDVLADVLAIAGMLEVPLGKLGESFTVEGVLEMFESKRVVENLAWSRMLVMVLV
jgi:hypothetical protein